MGTSITNAALTASGQYEYVVEIIRISPLDIFDLCNKTKFDDLCEHGCPNFNKKWSCPPYAPAFWDFASKWEHLYVLFVHTDMVQYSHIKNNYLKIKAANSILKSRADKFCRLMAAKHGSFVSTGSCRLCKPCRCKIGQPCAHTEVMTYSFEAMGIDVNKLVTKLFHKSLLWYKPHCLPEYTSVVCGLLTNDNLSEKELANEYKFIIAD